MAKPRLLDLWAGSIDLELSTARGNARTSTFTIAAAASRETRTDKAAAYFNQIYSLALVEGVSAATAEGYLGEDFNCKLSRIAEFQQRLHIFHNLSDPGAYRMNLDMSAVVNLKRWLAWHLTVSDRLLSEPVAGRQRNDLLYTTGLRLRFAR
ncbi:MAG: DUF481 domain-containing protein [Acidobacteria bacterium]|nr:DUF481 domain-containing protein [Acidobacteriota bacterium]